MFCTLEVIACVVDFVGGKRGFLINCKIRTTTKRVHIYLDLVTLIGSAASITKIQIYVDYFCRRSDFTLEGLRGKYSQRSKDERERERGRMRTKKTERGRGRRNKEPREKQKTKYKNRRRSRK